MPPSSTPTVRSALAVLAALEDVVDTAPGPDLDAPLTGAAPDRDAGPSEIGWVSAHAAPDRVRQFGGALLVMPGGIADRPPCAVAVARTPRLVFSLLIAALFPERTATVWPHAPAWVAPDAVVHPTARLAPGVVVGAGVVIGPRVEVGPQTVLAHCTLEADVTIGPHATIGTDGFGYTRDGDGVWVPFPHLGRVVIEAGATVGASTCIDRGALGDTRIGARTRVDNLVHIAHNVRIGADCVVIAHAMIAGGVEIGAGAWIAPSAAVRNQRTVGAGAVVGLGAVVVRDVPPGATVAGNPARPLEARPT